MKVRVAIYTRVSTDKQSVASQRVSLEDWAKRSGYEVVAVFEDRGVSGTTGRKERPALDRLIQGAMRREFDLVAAWAVDRLGRSLQHLIHVLDDLNSAGVDLYLHSQGLNTRTSSGKAMFGMLGVFADFERAMIVERVNAGIDRARAHGTKSGKAIGRPKLSDSHHAQVRSCLLNEMSVRAVADRCNVSVGTVASVRKALVLDGLLSPA